MNNDKSKISSILKTTKVGGGDVAAKQLLKKARKDSDADKEVVSRKFLKFLIILNILLTDLSIVVVCISWKNIFSICFFCKLFKIFFLN